MTKGSSGVGRSRAPPAQRDQGLPRGKDDDGLTRGGAMKSSSGEAR